MALVRKGEKKARIMLYIDAELWDKCMLYKKTANANWSEVAENVFYEIVEYLDGQAAVLEEAGNSASAERENKLYMHQVINSRIRKLTGLVNDSSSETPSSTVVR